MEPKPQDFGQNILNQSTAQFLVDLAQPNHEMIIELGSWVGFSAWMLAKRYQKATVLCVDTWLGSVDLHEMPALRSLIESSYERFLHNTAPCAERIWPLRMDTVNGLCLAWECGFHPSLIFIDAGHQYESAWGDIHAARRLFPEAHIVLDDYCHEGVGQAARELLPNAIVSSDGVAAWFRP